MADSKSTADWNDVKKTTQSFARSILQTTTDSLQDTYESSKDRMADAWEDFEKDARRALKSAETCIKKNPVSFVVGALAAGIVVGLLMRRR